MSSSLRHVLISLAIVVLAVLAHGRLLQAGFLGNDLHLVAASSGGDYIEEEPTPWMRDGLVRPAPVFVWRAIGSAFTAEPLDAHARGVTLRVTAFVVLLAGAAIAGFAIRRALLPWVGGDTARAAGFASALFMAVHPFSGAALARPRSLAELLCFLFGSVAAFLFLRGRQMRERGWVAAAGIAAILAGFSSQYAYLIPFVLAALELGSAQRPRPMKERLRTALTTFVIFAGCVLVESAVAAADMFHYRTAFHLGRRGAFANSLPDLSDWASPGRALASLVEKLGLLFFPVTGGALSTSWPSYLVCIAIVLVALWPMLRSARVAPRLWGSLAAVWIAIMLLALVPVAGLAVSPENGSRADALTIAATFSAMGLGVAATSLLGTRRIVLPALIAIGLSWLSVRGASHYVEATDGVARTKANLEGAMRAVDPGGCVFVVDPPRTVAGFDLELESALRILQDPEDADRAWITIPAESIPWLTRSDQFAAWRAHKVAFLEHETGLHPSVVPLHVRVIAPTAGTKPPLPWRGESRSPFVLDLDPATVRFVRVTPLAGTSTAEAPRMAWRASEPAGEWVGSRGVWLEGESGPIAVFDPWDDPAWWTAPTIRRVQAEDPLVKVALFELLPEWKLETGPPEIADVPEPGAGWRHEPQDWTFRIPEKSLARPLRGEASYVLEVYDPNDGDYRSIPCTESVSDGVVTVRGRVAPWIHAGSDVASRRQWSLERRVGDVVIARSSSDGAR